jgi:hypothetical protein
VAKRSKVLEITIRIVVGIIAFVVGLIGPGAILSIPPYLIADSMGQGVQTALWMVAVFGACLGLCTFMPMIVLCDNSVRNVIRGIKGLLASKKLHCMFLDTSLLGRFIISLLVRYRCQNPAFQIELVGGQYTTKLVFLIRSWGVALVEGDCITAYGWMKTVFEFDFDARVAYYYCTFHYANGIYYIVLGHVSGMTYGEEAQRGYVILTANTHTGHIHARNLGILWYDDTPPVFSIEGDTIFVKTELANGEHQVKSVDVDAGTFVEV